MVFHRKTTSDTFKAEFFSGVMILLSMLSGLAVMSQDGGTLGRVRQYDLNSAYCEEYDEENHQANKFHFHQILHWLYLIILSANALVVVCIVLIMAFLANWILDTILSALNPEQKNSEDDQPPPEYLLEHVASCSDDVGQDDIPLQANELASLVTT
ncbi:uncharacterized protein LOC114530682 [Dendronephthya gigantea]|uniref:uncharacterized protein LOC114530682 n=1 Tax=Dendronephthya gigantea TaxID=151771 RepID=UPI00106BD792|nr:uncharacterized protein LOC114530682 [Dendronephthya gigantea]XP_028408087.1 uncharacterized protein LOC114530682 [Dendronephthya gigantea]XP_028408088.1 uncharacterized protein LOC114530682 [Dendronephthya gigantea]